MNPCLLLYGHVKAIILPQSRLGKPGEGKKMKPTPPRQLKFQTFLRSAQVLETCTFAHWKQYEKTGVLELEQVLICKKEKTAGFHAKDLLLLLTTEKNAATSVGAFAKSFAKSADASRELDSW